MGTWDQVGGRTGLSGLGPPAVSLVSMGVYGELGWADDGAFEQRETWVRGPDPTRLRPPNGGFAYSRRRRGNRSVRVCGSGPETAVGAGSVVGPTGETSGQGVECGLPTPDEVSRTPWSGPTVLGPYDPRREGRETLRGTGESRWPLPSLHDSRPFTEGPDRRWFVTPHRSSVGLGRRVLPIFPTIPAPRATRTPLGVK